MESKKKQQTSYLRNQESILWKEERKYGNLNLAVELQLFLALDG